MCGIYTVITAGMEHFFCRRQTTDLQVGHVIAVDDTSAECIAISIPFPNKPEFEQARIGIDLEIEWIRRYVGTRKFY